MILWAPNTWQEPMPAPQRVIQAISQRNIRTAGDRTS
jgi:hypothetical protein